MSVKGLSLDDIIQFFIIIYAALHPLDLTPQTLVLY